MENDRLPASRIVPLFLTALLTLGTSAAFSASFESAKTLPDFSAMESPALDMTMNVEMNPTVFNATLNPQISARAMSEDFAQTAALIAPNPGLLSERAESAPQAMVQPAPMTVKSQDSAPEAIKIRAYPDKSFQSSSRSSAFKTVNALVSAMKTGGAQSRTRDLDALYLGDSANLAAASPSQDSWEKRWEERQQRESQKNNDWVNVSQNAASLARVLGAKRPAIVLELAKQGLRSREDIAAEYMALALGQISEIKTLRSHPKDVSELYRIALRKKDRAVGRYAAWHMDLFAKAFVRRHPQMVAGIFRLALRSKDSWVRYYALQNAKEFPTLARLLASPIRRAQARTDSRI